MWADFTDQFPAVVGLWFLRDLGFLVHAHEQCHLQSSYHLTEFWDGNLIPSLVCVITRHINTVLIVEVKA